MSSPWDTTPEEDAREVIRSALSGRRIADMPPTVSAAVHYPTFWPAPHDGRIAMCHVQIRQRAPTPSEWWAPELDMDRMVAELAADIAKQRAILMGE